MKNERTALLIRCSVQEANAIRAAAKQERRTVSAHVIGIVMRQIAMRQRLVRKYQEAWTRKGLLFPPEYQ